MDSQTVPQRIRQHHSTLLQQYFDKPHACRDARSTDRHPFNGLFSRTTWVSRHNRIGAIITSHTSAYAVNHNNTADKAVY